MAARQTRLIAVACALTALLGADAAGVAPDTAEGRQQSADRQTPAQRIVSLVPALTEMLFAIGAGPRVVGISSFDAFPPEVQRLPRVGALLDPDTERILALRPDLVLVYGSQNDARERFERAGIRTYNYRHGGVATVVATLSDLGRLTGEAANAARVGSELTARVARVRARVKGLKRPRTLLVVDRQPGTLRGMFVSGGRGFLNEMLDAAGGSNVFGDVARESAQPSHELLLARAPEVIIEVRAQGLNSGGGEEKNAWSVLPSLPAVRSGRIHLLYGEYIVVPGPRLAAGTEALARVLHPEAFAVR
jgi:iron complex transport system substrate-binding protein